MPVLWRYLLRGFLEIFLLSLTGFICVLLVMRLEEIAQFAAIGAPWGTVLLFTLYQIPYILPLAIPISCLIGCSFLFQKMSHSHELTALRAAGCSMRAIASPLLLTAGFLAIFNITLSCELVPRIRSYAKDLILEVTALNPLVLLQKDSLVKLKGAHLDMHASAAPGSAQDVLFITKNSSSGKLSLMIAKELSVIDKELHGSDVTFISSLDPKTDDVFDHLVIENQKEMRTATSGLSQFWEDNHWQTHADYLPLRALVAKEIISRRGMPLKLGKLHVELTRRFSLSLATLTFTLIGLSFGMQIGREVSKKGAIWSIGLAAFFLLTFITGKSLKTSYSLAIALFLLPHPIILLFCLQAFKRVGRGLKI